MNKRQEAVDFMLDFMPAVQRSPGVVSVREGTRGEMFVLEFVRSRGQALPGEISRAMQVSTARSTGGQRLTGAYAVQRGSPQGNGQPDSGRRGDHPRSLRKDADARQRDLLLAGRRGQRRTDPHLETGQGDHRSADSGTSIKADFRRLFLFCQKKGIRSKFCELEKR